MCREMLLSQGVGSCGQPSLQSMPQATYSREGTMPVFLLGDKAWGKVK